MNILHISTPLSWRGGEQQLMYLYAEFKKKGLNQYVLCPFNSQLYKLFPDKEKCITYKKKIFSDLFTAKTISCICKKNKINLIHTHDAHAHTKAILAALIFGNTTPIVVHRRVDFPVKKTFISKMKYNHRCIIAIICVSEAIKKIILPDIINKDKVHVVHSGIDLKRFPFQQKTGKLKKLLKIDDPIKIIGNTSALAPHKDYYTFVDTVSLITSQRNDVHFVIIGEGPLEKEIKNYVDIKNLSSYISFLGFRKDVAELLPDFDIFLVTSKTEGLGTSILDAFACKVPVVATQAGGIPELIENNVTGLLSEIGNPSQLSQQIGLVIANDKQRETLTENAFNKLQFFSKEATAEKILRIYRILSCF